MAEHLTLRFAVLFPILMCAFTQVDTPVRQRAVDLVLLDDGTRLLGVVMPNEAASAKQKSGVTMLLRHSWVEKNAGELLQQSKPLVEESAETTVSTLLQKEIERLQKAAEPNIQRITFLTEELNSLQPEEGDSASPDLLLLQIPEDRIRRRLLKTPQYREIAAFAILNALDEAETSKAVDLRKQLLKLAPQGLIRELPGQTATDPQQQLDRILIQADRMIGRTSKLIFHNGSWLSESASVQNQQQMLMQMMTGGLQSQLQQLLDETAGPLPGAAAANKALPQVLPANAIRIVEQEQADVVEVKSMKLQPSNGTATVSISVYWQKAKGDPWKRMEQVTGTAGQADVSEEAKQRIQQDERVQQVSQLFSGLGVGGAQLNSALTMGAVVESASGKADAMLQERLSALPTANAARLLVEKRKLSQKVPATSDD